MPQARADRGDLVTLAIFLARTLPHWLRRRVPGLLRRADDERAALLYSTPCCRCGAPGYASWTQHFCSLPDVAPDVYVYCAECDVALNAASVRFNFGEKYEAELETYRQEVVERAAAIAETYRDAAR